MNGATLDLKNQKNIINSVNDCHDRNLSFLETIRWSVALLSSIVRFFSVKLDAIENRAKSGNGLDFLD